MSRLSFSRPSVGVLAVSALLAGGAAGCGSQGGSGGSGSGPAAGAHTQTTTTKVEVLKQVGRFDPSAIYAQRAPGVVTVISVFPGNGIGSLLGGGGGGGGGGAQEGLGSGFVISENGEIATNAHVVTNGSGAALKRAKDVFVKFGDSNQVPAKIIGTDPNADVALIKVDPKGLNLRPLSLATDKGVTVGAPVVAIGSPFGEVQSLSVGVISATNRAIDSLNGKFSITGALQTDAAINHGNSGGPLLDAGGNVLGINSQIQSTGGGGEGVGFAVPIDLAKRSLDALRAGGKVSYAYLGVTSAPIYPQLAERFKLPVKQGAWLQKVEPGGPADRGGLRGGSRPMMFEASSVVVGGDIITKANGMAIVRESDLNTALQPLRAGDTVKLEVYRGKDRREMKVKLGERPVSAPMKSPAP